jgi:uncharacterized protein YjbJ (UPF0337 family)
MAGKRSSWRRWFGRVEQIIGNHTGDRRVEAKGAAEAARGKPASDEQIERVVEATRRQHKDIPPLRTPDAES